MARGTLFERQRADHPPYEANTVQDEQDPADDEREAGCDRDEDELEVCILDGNDIHDDDQTYDDIEMVDPDVVEEVGRAGLDDIQTQMDEEKEEEEKDTAKKL